MGSGASRRCILKDLEAASQEDLVAGCEFLNEDIQERVREALGNNLATVTRLTPLRPQHFRNISEWLTAGIPDLKKSCGCYYHEVELGSDFQEEHCPQLGWLTTDFRVGRSDGDGVGDDEFGWAADGVRHLKWHNGPAKAEWPRRWMGGDVIGLAIDLDRGSMSFSLNGAWVENAQMNFNTNAGLFFPAVSMRGFFDMKITQPSWQFAPPSEHYAEWSSTGIYCRPLPKKDIYGARRLFAEVDKNGDREVSPSELHEFLSLHGYSSRMIEALFAWLDKDENGMVTPEEFRDAFRYLTTQNNELGPLLDDLITLVPAPDGEDFSDLLEHISVEYEIDERHCLQLHNFKELSQKRLPPVAGCKISRVEMRGISLPQLRAVWAHVKRRCRIEKWTDWHEHTLDLERVTLYELTAYVIKPATNERTCSFVELVSNGPQPPTWFVSHWWGEPHRDFIDCLECHSRDRDLKESAQYWICAYANNQHKLEEDLHCSETCCSIAESSFAKAIREAKGTITVLDAQGVTYTRAWCAYEIDITLKEERSPEYLYDVYTAFPHKCMFTGREMRAVGLANGCDPNPGAKYQRERYFPVELAKKSLQVCLHTAEASRKEDRVRILNSISGQSNLDADPYETHERYDDLNQRLRGSFLGQMLVRLLEGGEPLESLMPTLKQAQITNLTMMFSVSDFKPSDDDLVEIAASLPPTLMHLSGNFASCKLTARAAVSFYTSAFSLPRLGFVCASFHFNTNYVDEMNRLCNGLSQAFKLLSPHGPLETLVVQVYGAQHIPMVSMEFAEALAKMLSENMSLKNVCFSGMVFTPEGAAAIAKSLDSNSVLAKMNVEVLQVVDGKIVGICEFADRAYFQSSRGQHTAPQDRNPILQSSEEARVEMFSSAVEEFSQRVIAHQAALDIIQVNISELKEQAKAICGQHLDS